MDGRVFPEGAFFEHPWWVNVFQNPGLVQFDHRIGAYLVAAGAVALFLAARTFKVARKISAHTLLAIVLLQIALGILTLLNQVPVALAALHQITAVVLFSAAIWHAYEMAGAKRSELKPAIAS
jgi:cytochrome c oxidase assembly protein subunit 15